MSVRHWIRCEREIRGNVHEVYTADCVERETCILLMERLERLGYRCEAGSLGGRG